MVYVNIFMLEGGSCGDSVILRAELLYEGGAGSKAADVERDKLAKPNSAAISAAKRAVGGTRSWKSAYKCTEHCGVEAEGGPGSATAYLRRHAAAIELLEERGLAGTLRASWDAGAEAETDEPAFVGVTLKPDPSGLAVKKLLQELEGLPSGGDNWGLVKGLF